MMNANDYTHILNVKTSNAPFLLNRFLSSFVNYTKLYNKNLNSIIINVINDSSVDNPYEKEYTNVVYKFKQKGLNINIFTVRSRKVQEFLTTSGKLFSNDSVFRMLFTPNGFMEDVEDPLFDFGGNICAHNIESIITLWQIGHFKLNPQRVIVTYHDDDVLYKRIKYKNGILTVDVPDYLLIREQLISQGGKFLIGKYCEHSGSPINLVYDYVKVLADMVDNQQIIVWNPNTEKGEVISAYIAKQMISSIHQASVTRTPIVGIIDSDSLKTRPINTLVPDLGYYTILATEIIKFPVVNIWVNEFYISWINKIERLKNPNYLQWEEPLIHRRVLTDNARNIIDTDLFSSVLNNMAIRQLNYERLLLSEREIFLTELFGKSYPTDAIRFSLTTMLKLKMEYIEHIRKIYDAYYDRLLSERILSKNFLNQLGKYLSEYEKQHSLNVKIKNRNKILIELNRVRSIRSTHWAKIIESLSDGLSVFLN